MFSKSDSESERWRKFWERQAKMILEYGWIVQGVFPTGTSPGISFGYTIGLTTAGLPELIMSGNFRPEVTQALINTAAKIHLGDEIVPGQEVHGISADDKIVFRAQAARCGDHIQQALNYYGDPYNKKNKIKLIQLIWPDKDGRYPGDEGYDGSLQDLWPVLDAELTDEHVERLAAEAEQGYDIDRLRPRD